jgi:hypothetical protein
MKGFAVILAFGILALAGVGHADSINLGTGDYTMDMGGGDKLNLGTGDYTMDMGGGDKLNLDTGDYEMNLD